MRGGKYAIHGTNRPASVGGLAFRGCTRMCNSDIRSLNGR
jgi:lipoprotein-anchoring transpeptidase ErfK/SrfK